MLQQKILHGLTNKFTYFTIVPEKRENNLDVQHNPTLGRMRLIE
jgi:hypothetical protein